MWMGECMLRSILRRGVWNVEGLIALLLVPRLSEMLVDSINDLIIRFLVRFPTH